MGTADPTSLKSCRLKVCEDIKLSNSSACALEMQGCISNGINCILKGKCSTYTSKEACSAGGTDGVCVFSTASQTTPNKGVCKLMTNCQDAN